MKLLIQSEDNDASDDELDLVEASNEPDQVELNSYTPQVETRCW